MVEAPENGTRANANPPPGAYRPLRTEREKSAPAVVCQICGAGYLDGTYIHSAMPSLDDLKNRAVGVEHAQRLPEAAELFIRLARETEGPHSAAWWRRAGGIQGRLQQPVEAARSYDRAIEGFVAAELRNAAISTGLERLESGSQDPTTVARVLRLVVENGYRRFARRLAVGLARSGAASADPAVGEEVVRYLQRWPHDAEVAVAELVEAVAESDAADAVPLLKTLASGLPEGSVPQVREAVRRALARTDTAESMRFSEPTIRDSLVEAYDEQPEDELPLIIDSRAGSAIDPRSIPRLEGLVPTNVRVDDEEGIVDSERLVVEGDRFGAGLAADDDRPLSAAQRDGGEDGADPDSHLPFAARSGSGGGAERDDPDQVEIYRHSHGYPKARESGEADVLAGLDLAAVLRELTPLAPGSVEQSEAADHYEFAMALRKAGLNGDALVRLRASLEGGYDPFPALEAIGEILMEQRDPQAAVRILRHVRHAGAASGPEAAGVLYWLARGEEAHDHYREAALLFEKVIRAAPGYRDAAERLRSLPADDFDTHKQLN